ncbi:hypothetical protein DIE19_29385 [Burkholderia sp. Bp9126]|nr:hypothetical protein DIE19_29385 [Burkholderia sp. Bp9126]
MATKYEDLAQQAIQTLAEFDVIERELKSQAARLICGYAEYIAAPAGRLKYVPVDAAGQIVGSEVPLSDEAPLEQRLGGLWWVGMPVFGGNRRTHAGAIRSWLAALERQGLVRRLGTTAPASWLKIEEA